MPLTHEESRKVISDIEVLKNTSKQVFNALSENSAQTKENNGLIFTLISKMDKHDVRREYEKKQLELDRAHVGELKNAVSNVNNRLDAYIDNVKPVMSRVKDGQDSVDNIKKSMGSAWGKMAVGVMVSSLFLFVAYSLGIEVKL
tara:strand:+ start:360 stop:791 length:432 start_codon:yes stop_codon:yes gene_type:complete